MRLVFILFVLLLTMTCYADLTTPPKATEQQYFLNQNKLINPGFELGLTGVSTTTTSATITTTSDLVNDGSRALSWNPSAAATLDLASWTTPSGSQMNGMAQCAFRTNDSDYDLQVIDASQTVIANTDIYSDSAGFVYYKTSVPFAINPSGSQTYKLRINAPGDENQLYVDSCYLGPNPVINYTDNYANIYSAQVSSTDVVSSESSDWLNGDCTDGSTGRANCLFKTGIFNQTPNCVVASTVSGSNNQIQIVSQTASGLAILTSSAGTLTNQAFNLTCQKSELDSGFVVRMDQTNFGPTPFTISATGFGTITNPSATAWRAGSKLKMLYKFTAGTTTATEARIELPFLLSTPSSGVMSSGTIVVGNCAYSGTGASYPVQLGEANKTYLTFGVAGTTSASATKSNGTDFTTGSSLSCVAEVPISTWSENQNAPYIQNAFVNSYGPQMRTETARIVLTGTVSQEYGDFISGNCTNASVQVCTLRSGLFSAIPNCMANSTDTGGNSACSTNATSTTSVSIKCQNDAGSSTTTVIDKNLICIGPR